MGQGFLHGQGTGKKTAQGTFTATDQKSITISGVGFQPKGIALFWDGAGATYSGSSRAAAVYDDGTNKIHVQNSGTSIQAVSLTSNLSTNADGFTSSNFASVNFINGTWRWIAWKD